MDGNGETIFNVKIGNHHTETTIKEWLFGVPGVCTILSFIMLLKSIILGGICFLKTFPIQTN